MLSSTPTSLRKVDFGALMPGIRFRYLICRSVATRQEKNRGTDTSVQTFSCHFIAEAFSARFGIGHWGRRRGVALSVPRTHQSESGNYSREASDVLEPPPKRDLRCCRISSCLRGGQSKLRKNGERRVGTRDGERQESERRTRPR